MTARFAACALLVVTVASTQASASILSASNSVGHVKAQDVDYLNVTTVQDGLNASLADQARVASGEALGGTLSPSSTGGFMPAGSGGAGLGSSGGLVGTGGGLLDIPNRNRVGLRIGRGGNNAGGISSHHRRDRRRGGVQAAPEPSTWLLLGTGLGMCGFYLAMRRRRAVSI